MSQMFGTVPAFGGGQVDRAPGLGVRVAGLLEAVRREWQIRQDLKVIAAMDGHELADIGIGPGAAEGALRHGRSRKPVGEIVAMARPEPALPMSFTERR